MFQAYLSTVLRYLYITWLFPLPATLYFHFTETEVIFAQEVFFAAVDINCEISVKYLHLALCAAEQG